jgi:hypothetical protein
MGAVRGSFQPLPLSGNIEASAGCSSFAASVSGHAKRVGEDFER